MKVLFLGTPRFAVPSLEALLSSRHEAVGVVTQPDRALRHGKTEVSPVKALATLRGLPVFQPQRIRDEVQELKNFGADIAVTVAYGQILTQAVLDAFPLGVINVHASLLPKYRGASPINAAIAAGETVTGVSIMRTEKGLDTGDVLYSEKLDILDGETAGELGVRLAELGARALIRALDNFGELKPFKQNDAEATHCHVIAKDEQFIDFCRPVREVVNFVRSLSPSPCAKTVIDGEVYKIYRAIESVEGWLFPAEAATVVRSDNRLTIACADGAVDVTVIQAPSKRAMNTEEFLNGRKFKVGTRCEKQL